MGEAATTATARSPATTEPVDHPNRMRARSHIFAAVLAAICCLAVCTSSAQADGDPASDYLITTDVFFPFFKLDERIPFKAQRQLLGLCAEAKQKGFPIRVAIISGPYDLGAVTSLWLKPQTYARFLAEEIRFAYKERLLIVMPNGFGFNRGTAPTNQEQKLLTKLQLKAGDAGLIDSAIEAVDRLAAADGVKLSSAAVDANATKERDRPLMVVAAAMLVVSIVAARFGLMRSQRSR
jgi:hypothetical protein